MIRVPVEFIKAAMVTVGGKDEPRTLLKGIHVRTYPDSDLTIVVSSNGYVMSVFDCPYESNASPYNSDGEYVGVPKLELNVTIPSDVCERVVKYVKGFKYLQEVYIGEESVFVHDTHIPYESLGQYPPWEKVVPEFPDDHSAFPQTVGYNPTYIAMFGKIATILGATGEIALRQGKRYGAALVRLVSHRTPFFGYEPSFFGIIMPVICNKDPQLPDWFSTINAPQPIDEVS